MVSAASDGHHGECERVDDGDVEAIVRQQQLVVVEADELGVAQRRVGVDEAGEADVDEAVEVEDRVEQREREQEQQRGPDATAPSRHRLASWPPLSPPWMCGCGASSGRPRDRGRLC